MKFAGLLAVVPWNERYHPKWRTHRFHTFKRAWWCSARQRYVSVHQVPLMARCEATNGL